MTALLAWERLGSKVCDRHLARLAVVYVRQSTRQQVIDHGESTRLQYGLVERAVALGWPTSRVLVIDEDLGKSGASAAGRVGFGRLVTEITMGHVGLVLGIEMSRLARSGADWYQLLELCALSGALLADADGVYDPVEFNDRLLLGSGGDDERGRAAPARGSGCWPASRPRHGGASWRSRCRPAMCAAPRARRRWTPTSKPRPWCGWSSPSSSSSARCMGCCAGWSTTTWSWGCGYGLGRTRASWCGGGPTG
jgi:Resolvase, N terminal domain